MIFMALFWIIIFFILFFWLLNKIPLWQNKFSSIVSFLVIFQAFLFLLALATDDPLFPSSFGLDPWWELTIEGIVASFAIWKAYLDPLKKKVYSLDREVGEIKTEMKTKFAKIEIDVMRMETHISRVETDISLIKEKVLKL